MDNTRAVSDLTEALAILAQKRAELETAGLLTAQRDPVAVEAYHRQMGLATSTAYTGAAAPPPPLIAQKLQEIQTRRAEQLAIFRLAGGKCEACFDQGVLNITSQTAVGPRLVRGYCNCERGQAEQANAEQRAVEEWQRSRAEAWQDACVPAAWRDFTLDSHPLARYAGANTPGTIAGDTWLGIQQWLQQPERSCVITGPTGTGKTGLVVGMLRARHDEGWRARYVFVPELLAQLRRSYDRESGGGEDAILDPLRRVPLLALDDIGMERRTDWSSDKLGELISIRHAHALPTIVTSNYDDLNQLARRFGELGSRIIWRLAEAARPHIYTMSGLPNLREVKK